MAAEARRSKSARVPAPGAGLDPGGASGRKLSHVGLLLVHVGGQHLRQVMPVILTADDRERCMSGSYEEIVELARPYPDDAMRIVEDERDAALL